jgi:hypothetical protein
MTDLFSFTVAPGGKRGGELQEAGEGCIMRTFNNLQASLNTIKAIKSRRII